MTIYQQGADVTREPVVPLVDDSNCLLTDVHWFTTEASDLGILAGMPWPRQMRTSLGNREPFVLHHFDHDDEGELRSVVYKQSAGILRLRVFND